MVPRLLLPLVALCALGGCLTPDYHCRIICGPAPDRCPANFTCDTSTNLCARMGQGETCPPFAPAVDAAVDTAAPDGPAPAENPVELCYGGACLTLSPEMRQTLVLWLDPSNLPAKDMPVILWPDRSREGNDAVPLPVQTPPRSRGDGLELSAMAGGPLLIVDDASLDFGAGDFTLLVVARLAAAPPSCLFAKSSFDRTNPRGLVMGWTYSTELGRTIYRASINDTVLATPTVGLGDLTPRVFGLRRNAGSAEARVNGEGVTTAVIAPTVSVSTTDNGYLGSCGPTGAPIAVLHAAIAFKGPLPLSDVRRLEAFLMGAFPASSP